MRTLVVSTAGYCDAWVPFVRLWREFCGARPLTLVSDIADGPSRRVQTEIEALGVSVLALTHDDGWCATLAAGVAAGPADEVVLVLQEDFLLTAAPDMPTLDSVDDLLWVRPDVGAVRLYPCPGPVVEEAVDALGPYVLGEIGPGEPYRVSCQAAAWRPAALLEVLAHVQAHTINAGADTFELVGSKLATNWRVLGVLRSAPQWPIQYFCSAISRGAWEPDALRFLAARGISVSGVRPVRKVPT